MFQKLIALAAWGALAFITFATLSPIGLRPHIAANIGIEHIAAFSVARLLFGLSSRYETGICSAMLKKSCKITVKTRGNHRC